MVKHFLIIILLFTSNIVFSQFQYKNVELDIVSKHFYRDSHIESFTEAINYLPVRYSTKGDVDYTIEIQRALNENSKVILPNFPILINSNGLEIKSNKIIFFQKKSKIVFRGLALGRFNDILKIYNSKNVEIYNLNIEGSKNLPNQKGEWSAGVSIINSENIKISNGLIKNTWGDGIFIGSENGNYSKDIIIESIWIDNARRNGISITSLVNGWLNNIYISNTNGTSPECGIDIEPSLNTELLKNINLSNIETFNNKAGALAINLTNLNSDDKFSNEVSISINNWKDNYSGNLIILSFNPLNKKKSVKGLIKLNNVNGNNIKSYGLWKDSNKSNIKLINNNFHFTKKNAN